MAISMAETDAKPMKKSYPIWVAEADIPEPLPTGLQRQLAGGVPANASSTRLQPAENEHLERRSGQVHFCYRSQGIHALENANLPMLGHTSWSFRRRTTAFTISCRCITKILDAIAEGICRAVANFRSRFILYFQSNAIVNFTWLGNPQATHFVEFKACLTREYAAQPPQLCMSKGNSPGLGIVPLRKTPETHLPEFRPRDLTRRIRYTGRTFLGPDSRSRFGLCKVGSSRWNEV